MGIAFDNGVAVNYGSVVNGVPLYVGQMDELWMHVFGTFVGTLTFSVSFDNINYTAVFVQTFSIATSPTSYVNVATAPAILRALVEGANWLRIDCTVYTSGTISVKSNGTKTI